MAAHDLPQSDAISDEKSTPPADVGLQPWLQVIGGFCLMFNCWGIALSWGTFQTYYTSGGISDVKDSSSIAWIGSIQAFLLTGGFALGGKYFDAGYFRPIMWSGSFFVVFGLMMTSLSTKYYQVMLAQGVCVGIGLSLVFVPGVGLPSTWFHKRRGLALGICLSGGSIGGIIYPITLHEVIPKVGFPWAVRIIGFLALAMLAVPLAVMRQRLPPRARGTIMEYQALREPVFALYTIGIVLTFLGFFTFYNFVEEWAVAEHVDTKGLQVFYILPIVNATSIFGRLLPNFWSDFIGPLNVQTPCILISGILVLVWIPTDSVGPLMAIVILYGFFSGALIGSCPQAVAWMTEDMTRFGVRCGVMFLALGLASLIGSPINGVFVRQNGQYVDAQIFSGVVMIAGAGFCLLARMLKTEWVLMAKA